MDRQSLPPGEGARQAATAFLDQLDKDDYCALMVFGTGVKSLVEFTHDKGQVQSALERLKAVDAKTYLYQALYDAIERGTTELAFFQAQLTGGRIAYEDRR